MTETPDPIATDVFTRELMVQGRPVLTDSEGYLRHLGDWSEDFVRALAAHEELTLTAEHWAIIRYLREYYAEHGVQAQVRVMIKHFTELWGPGRGNNHYLHELFPRGGPQKQGNRLAGLLRTKGEH
ncbi:MAG: TusE/DsrC/DsvC family sulfur relay protein [Hylemonella sp.]|nr:TusE/DsrC/DsvC family sulfur relay protein [Hylemonella sp.]